MSKKQHYTSSNGNKYEIAGGVYTGYSFREEGQEDYSILGYDNPTEVRQYIEDRENGKRHFMDTKEE